MYVENKFCCTHGDAVYTNVFIRIRFLQNKQLEKLKENICDV